MSQETDLNDPSLYTSRELSWLDFNDRVLQLAEGEGQPLFERLKYAAIYTSNLDEFFMIRVAGLYEQLQSGLNGTGISGLTPSETIDQIYARVSEQLARQSRCFSESLLPQLAANGLQISSCSDLTQEQLTELNQHFRKQIFPVLTPLAVGLGRPFPYISNLSLSLAVLLRDPVTGNENFARVKVPKEMLARFVPFGDGRSYVLMEDLIAHNLGALFPGMEILDYSFFRVTRDADFTVSDEADDLIRAVEDELRRRRFGETVRLELAEGINEVLRERLIEALEVEERQVYSVEGMLDLTDLWQLVKLPGFAKLRDHSWKPVTHPRLQGDEDSDKAVDVMAAMRRGDILVHHPYDSFVNSVERFIEQAVADPDVLAIKQTVYRTSDDSPLVPALIRAADRGKQAVCLVELKARFDERANIQWARALEQSGVHVVYGPPTLKTHAKCILVVRREGQGVRNYVHIGTGNYHSATARLYTDFGLFTTDEKIGADVADMFNYLTGYARPTGYRKALVAPDHLRDQMIEQIDAAAESSRQGSEARVLFKMNSLVDPDCIEALYRASQAGVKIDLNIRGICSLIPGIEGVSDNIRVVSVVGRFLEHSRVFCFAKDGQWQVFIGSADLMPRNLDNRVELLAPVESESLKLDLIEAITWGMEDQTNAWQLNSSGEWLRVEPAGVEALGSQEKLMRLHAARAAEASKTT